MIQSTAFKYFYGDNMSKVALITGITGQDGSYLAELLLENNYEVHGLVRRASTGINTQNIDHIKDRLHLHYSDLTDSANLENIISKIKPQEIYNLGAQSHVSVSFECPHYTGEVNAIGVLNLLEAIRKQDSTIKFYQASTSELYGKVKETPQTERTPFHPRSPYSVAKLYGYWITVNYRESYNIFGCNGILFNHESPRRGPEFVTRKIVQGMIRTHLGLQSVLELGNLNARRDWGHAKDYVKAMWLMLQQDVPDDYVISSGEEHSVRDFCERVADYLGFEIEWRGEELNEVGVKKDTNQVVIRVNKNFYRPAEVPTIFGNCNKAKSILGWTPEYNFNQLVHEMCAKEMEIQKNVLNLRKS
jgi:GDPmannose 4,6-dehydratase